MADYKFQQEHTNIPELVASIAALFDAHLIPYVLWESALTRLYGVPAVTEDIAFVIPDDLMKKAREGLQNANFFPCTYGDACARTVVKNNPSPIPDVHFYVKPEEGGGGGITRRASIELFKKSHMLWRLPDLPLRAPAADDPNFWLASDPRLPTDPYPSSLYPVKIVSPVRFAEALMLLRLRDADPSQATLQLYWMGAFTFLVDAVQNGALNAQYMEHMEPRLRRLLQLGMEGPAREYKSYSIELYKTMKENNELPPPPPPYPWEVLGQEFYDEYLKPSGETFE